MRWPIALLIAALTSAFCGSGTVTRKPVASMEFLAVILAALFLAVAVGSVILWKIGILDF